ncbi:MAG: cytochrome C [Gammaproteobacteria bacterium]
MMFGLVNVSRVRTGVAILGACVSLSVQGQSLPEAEGSELVNAVCTTCHRTNLIARSSGYTRAHWDELTSTMINLGESPQKDSILDYLAAHFPPSDNRKATPVAGDIDISFTSWKVPTLGQRSRDPVEAPDGTIWWVGQTGNILGQLNPESGEMKEYVLPKGAHPHSAEIDNNGDVWYTGNRNGTVAKLVKGTDTFQEFKMPDPKARDPHTAIFDEDNTMFFTLQQSNMIGRLVPSTGEITLVDAPTPKSRPYGIKIDSNGTVWVACNGSNCLLSIDRDTMKVTEHKLPQEGTTVRRLDVAEDDTIWYVNSRLGYLGHYNPKTGKAQEWESPSGRSSHPYALVVVNGIVWYNESGVRPDMLVRFDPKDESFQSWPVPSGNVRAGIIRHMRATKEGDILIHQSSTNHILRVNLD